MSRVTNYAWDTTVFIAWLKMEASAPLDDIALVVDEIDSKMANLTLSVITFSEILLSKCTQDQRDLLSSFLARSNVIAQETTIRIAQKGAEIREQGLAAGRNIKTPDATIMATAILHQADALHTLESNWLGLSRTPIVDGLLISPPMPISGQRGLQFTL